MSRQPPFKAYGHIHPVDEVLYAALRTACATALPDTDDVPVLEREGDMARISFEGVYFPEEDVLAALAPLLGPGHRGKLDVLDLENWRLTRHVFADGRSDSRSVPLNHVLDHGGH